MKKPIKLLLSILVYCISIPLADAQTYSLYPNDTVLYKQPMAHFGGIKIHLRNLCSYQIILQYKKISVDFPGTDWRGELCDNAHCYTWLPDSGMFKALGPKGSWNDLGNLYVQAGTGTKATPGVANIRYAIWDIYNPWHVDTLTYIFTAYVHNGINGEGNSNAFQISPNPVKEELTIIFDTPNSDYSTEITGLRGEVIARSQNESKVNVSQLANGVYFLKVVTSEGISIQKFIKY